MNRVGDKIKELEEYLADLESYVPSNVKELDENSILQDGVSSLSIQSTSPLANSSFQAGVGHRAFDFEEYMDDKKTRDACEHCFERIIEALADLAFLVISQLRIDAPKDDIGAFVILSEYEVINKELAEKLKDAKGMRNILSHEYGKVNDEQVFEMVNGEIEKDAMDFIKCVKEKMK